MVETSHKAAQLPHSHNPRAQSNEAVADSKVNNMVEVNGAVAEDRPGPSPLLRAEQVLDLGHRQAAKKTRKLIGGRQIKYSRKPAKKYNGGCN